MDRARQLRADVALLAVAAVWGGTFVMVQDATAQASCLPFNGTRFVVAAGLLAACGPRRLAGLTRLELSAGTLIGVFLGSGYGLQTLGLRYTSSSKAAFLTGLATLLIPIFAILIGRRPDRWAALGAGAATVGLTLVNWKNEQIELGIGEWLVLGCAVVFAWHLLTQSLVAERCDPLRLAVVQVAAAAAVNFGAAAIVPGDWDAGITAAAYGPSVWGAIAFLAVFATAAAFFTQAWAQQFTTPTHTALIFATEPVFGAIFGVWLAGDRLSGLNWSGCGLILAGIVLAEAGPVWRALRGESEGGVPASSVPAEAAPPGAGG
jgi:drug/metabolite transporter (DMT)-like permease